MRCECGTVVICTYLSDEIHFPHEKWAVPSIASIFDCWCEWMKRRYAMTENDNNWCNQQMRSPLLCSRTIANNRRFWFHIVRLSLHTLFSNIKINYTKCRSGFMKSFLVSLQMKYLNDVFNGLNTRDSYHQLVLTCQILQMGFDISNGMIDIIPMRHFEL